MYIFKIYYQLNFVFVDQILDHKNFRKPISHHPIQRRCAIGTGSRNYLMTKKFGIIGNPIDHSLSPEIHNYWIKENKIEAKYDTLTAQQAALKTEITDLKSKLKESFKTISEEKERNKYLLNKANTAQILYFRVFLWATLPRLALDLNFGGLGRILGPCWDPSDHNLKVC